MAVSSSKSSALVPYTGKVGTNLVDEKIDERILRLLGLEDIFDIDYDTYASLLRSKMGEARLPKSKIPTEETELITDEWKRVKGKKGRFKVKKKKITAQSFKKGSATGIKINQKLLSPAKPLALPPAAEEDPLQEIIKILTNIVETLTAQNALQKKKNELGRRSSEKAGREDAEGKLEKGLGVVKKIADKLLAPVKNILQKILDFFLILLMGRAVYLLIGWFGNKENQSKVRSIIRFLSDWWPSLLGAFLIFGTGLGGFVASITGVLLRGIVALTARSPAALGTILGGGVLAGATLANNKKDTAERIKPEDQTQPQTEPAKPQEKLPVVKAAGGGLIKLLGGLKEGLTKNKGLATAIGAAAGSALGPLGTILGAVAGHKSGDIAGEIQGLISGQKGVDKIPAMLSDGEFVMSRGAVKKYGVDYLEAMNAAGGGTNKPKIVKETVKAAGGGYIGSDDAKKERVKDKTLEQREKERKKYGPGATPNISTQEDFDRFKARAEYEEFKKRVKRIEQQLGTQKALASGKGINLKGSSLGMNIGRGYGATYRGRKSIIAKGAAMSGWEPEINVGGMRYFGQVKGSDVIYTSHYASGLAGQIDKYGARNKTYKSSGAGLVGGSGLKKTDKKDLPKSRIMTGPDGKIFVGYLTFQNGQPFYERAEQRQKGILENITNFFDPKGAKSREETLNARTVRMTSISDLEDYRKRGMKEENIKKMMGPRYDRAVNDLKAKKVRIKKEEDVKKDANMAKYSVDNIRRAQSTDQKSKLNAAQLAKSKPASSRKVTPPSKPPVVVKTKSDLIGRGGGGVNKGSGSKVPKFGATCKTTDRPRTAKILGIF
jgi:hypothetical protein